MNLGCFGRSAVDGAPGRAEQLFDRAGLGGCQPGEDRLQFGVVALERGELGSGECARVVVSGWVAAHVKARLNIESASEP